MQWSIYCASCCMFCNMSAHVLEHVNFTYRCVLSATRPTWSSADLQTQCNRSCKTMDIGPERRTVCLFTSRLTPVPNALIGGRGRCARTIFQQSYSSGERMSGWNRLSKLRLRYLWWLRGPNEALTHGWAYASGEIMQLPRACDPPHTPSTDAGPSTDSCMQPGFF